MNVTILIVVTGVFTLAGLLAIIFAIISLQDKRIHKRLQEQVVEINTPRWTRSPTHEALELKGSFIDRLVIPGFRKIIAFFGRFTPEASIKKANQQLAIARYPLNLRGRDFYGLRIFILFVGMGAAILFITTYNDLLAIIGSIVMLLFAYLLPIAWLRSKVRHIQDQVSKGLPDVLDMLSVCASAGLGFDQAMKKVSEYWQTSLGYEFHRVIQEMEVGVSRAEALRNMSNRLQVMELSSFVALIIQAEILGMQISDVLHAQAEQMRILRQFRAKEIANRLPARMILPMAIFIMPALFAVIIGPVIPSIIESIFS